MIKIHPSIILFMVLPLAATGLIVLAHHSQERFNFALPFSLAGIASTVITALADFMQATIPIAPYKTGK